MSLSLFALIVAVFHTGVTATPVPVSPHGHVVWATAMFTTLQQFCDALEEQTNPPAGSHPPPQRMMPGYHLLATGTRVYGVRGVDVYCGLDPSGKPITQGEPIAGTGDETGAIYVRVVDRRSPAFGLSGWIDTRSTAVDGE